MTSIESFIAKGFYFEIAPVVLLGIICGLISFFRQDDADNEDATIKTFIANGLTSFGMCIICYAILDSVDLSYMSRLGISGFIGIFGVDKALDLAQKLLSLRGGGGNTHHKSGGNDA